MGKSKSIFDMVYIRKIKCFLGLLLLVSFFITGCVRIASTPRILYMPELHECTVSNDYYVASIYPFDNDYYLGGFCGFHLIIENKTDKDIELDWNRTLFINNGKTNGGFMFEGIVYGERNNPKSPDTIFARSTFSKNIWPNALVGFSNGWYHDIIRSGEHGVLLSIDIEGEEVREKLLLNVYAIPCNL